MSSAKRLGVLAASAINGAGFLLSSAATLLWWLLLAKDYPPGPAGQLILAISAAGVINLLDFGVSQGLVVYLSNAITSGKQEKDVKPVLKNALLRLLMLQAMVGGLGIMLWTYWHPDDAFFRWSTCLAVLGFALSTQALQFCVAYLKGLLNFRTANLIATGSAVAVYGTGAAMVNAQIDGPSIISWLSVIQAVIALVVVVVLFRSHVSCREASMKLRNETEYRAILKVSLPLYPQMFTGIFFNHIQRFLIAKFVGLEFVAILSLAFSLSTRIHAVVNAFFEVLFPYASRVLQSGKGLLSVCVKAGALASIAYLLGCGLVALTVYVYMPTILKPFFYFSLGVVCSVVVAPAFHLLNGSGQGLKVSLASAITPLSYLLVAYVLGSLELVDSTVLLPFAYFVASLILVTQIFGSLIRVDAAHSK